MSIFIFCVGMALFSAIISYKYNTIHDASVIMYYERTCDENDNCIFDSKRIVGSDFSGSAFFADDIDGSLEQFAESVNLFETVTNIVLIRRSDDPSDRANLQFEESETDALIIHLNYSTFTEFDDRFGFAFYNQLAEIGKYVYSKFTHYSFQDFSIDVWDLTRSRNDVLSIIFSNPERFPTLSRYIRSKRGNSEDFIIQRALNLSNVDEISAILRSMVIGIPDDEIVQLVHLKQFNSFENYLLLIINEENPERIFDRKKKELDIDSLMQSLSEFDRSDSPITTYLIVCISISFLALSFFVLINILRMLTRMEKEAVVVGFVSKNPFLSLSIVAILGLVVGAAVVG